MIFSVTKTCKSTVSTLVARSSRANSCTRAPELAIGLPHDGLLLEIKNCAQNVAEEDPDRDHQEVARLEYPDETGECTLANALAGRRARRHAARYSIDEQNTKQRCQQKRERDQQQIGDAHIANEGLRDQRADQRTQRAASGDKSEEPVCPIRREYINHVAPEDRYDEQIEHTHPNEEDRRDRHLIDRRPQQKIESQDLHAEAAVGDRDDASLRKT